jgi:hypothetical protein
MVQSSVIQQPVIMRTNFFNKREVAEIPKLLIPGERILAMVSGVYAAGTAVLCVTSKRVLLVDKKIIRLSIEDMRFDSIKEVNYSHQALMASLQLFYVGRSQQFQFKSWHRNGLRGLSQLVQEKMFELSDGKELVHDESTQDEDPITKQHSEWARYYKNNKKTEQYLQERLMRWRRASRFTDMLTFSTKFGRQILKFETDL